MAPYTIKCKGACSRELSHLCYSKANRGNGPNICRDCQGWRDAVETDIAPTAPLNSTTDARSHDATAERLRQDAQRSTIEFRVDRDPTSSSLTPERSEALVSQRQSPPRLVAYQQKSTTNISEETNIASAWFTLQKTGALPAIGATKEVEAAPTSSRVFGTSEERRQDRFIPDRRQRQAAVDETPQPRVIAPPYEYDGSDEE